MRKIVIKIGSSILTSGTGRFSARTLARIGSEVLALGASKREVVLVSSGAIALGMESQGIRQRPAEMARLQACAAIGQGKLMSAYERFFRKNNRGTAQLLLTRDGLEDRDRFLKARNTLEELLKMGIVPIVNENDTVATEEIAFGDNDVLSVQTAHLIHADLVVLYTDVDGFYLRDRTRIRRVASVAEIDHELVGHLRDAKRSRTVGGMKAKLEAARTSMRLGIPLLIVDGRQKAPLLRFLAGEDVGTLFLASNKPRSSKKKWIAFSAPKRGSLILDEGARGALESQKRSLLPGGILQAVGNFLRGDVVELRTKDGRIFGRGVVRYSSRDINRIAGNKSSAIKRILGEKPHDEVVHRNDMVLW